MKPTLARLNEELQWDIFSKNFKTKKPPLKIEELIRSIASEKGLNLEIPEPGHLLVRAGSRKAFLSAPLWADTLACVAGGKLTMADPVVNRKMPQTFKGKARVTAEHKIADNPHALGTLSFSVPVEMIQEEEGKPPASHTRFNTFYADGRPVLTYAAKVTRVFNNGLPVRKQHFVLTSHSEEGHKLARAIKTALLHEVRKIENYHEGKLPRHKITIVKGAGIQEGKR